MADSDLAQDVTRRAHELTEAVARLVPAVIRDSDSASIEDMQEAAGKMAEALTELRSLEGMLSHAVAFLDLRSVGHSEESKRAIVEARHRAADFLAAWMELNKVLTERLLRLALDSPAQGAPRWDTYWGPDGEMARNVATGSPRLDENERTLLLLRYEKGLQQKEIAEIIDVSQPSVASRLSRVEAKVTEALAFERTLQTLAAQGWIRPAQASTVGLRYDLLVEKDGMTIAVEVTSDYSWATRHNLTNLLRASERATAHGVQVLLAVYFPKDGEVGFYRPRDLADLLRRGPSIQLDQLREAQEPSWAVEGVLRTGKHERG